MEEEPATPGRSRGQKLLSGAGRTLIGAGVLLLLFAAYQLWGTGIHEARAQSNLRGDFADTLADAGLGDDDADLPAQLPPPDTTATGGGTSSGESPAGVADDGSPSPGEELAAVPPPISVEEGDPIARIRIPIIGVDKIVVAGVGIEDLKKGPGYYPGTTLPGHLGNAAIAGHRTTYGAPFWSLEELAPGDAIYVTTVQGRFAYRVRESMVVKPDAVEVLDPSNDARLTLTTCNPRFSARERLVVVADLVGEPIGVDVSDADETPPSDAIPGEDTTDEEPPATTATAAADDEPATVTGGETAVLDLGDQDAGLSGESAPRGPVVVWALIVTIIGVGIWLVARAWRRWPAYLLGAPVFLVALFLFFEQVARLLPANV
jgi:sortase A